LVIEKKLEGGKNLFEGIANAVARLQRGRWHAAMLLYVCNGPAGAQRRRCTSATGPLARSDAVVRLQRTRWGAAELLYAYNGLFR